MRDGFTAVVAARDEEGLLPATLDALFGIPNLSRLVVADDGSRDATAALARAAGAEVVSLPSPRGKGAALRAGILLARSAGPSFSAQPLLLADADLGPSASRLAALLDALDEDHPASVAAFPKGVAARGGFGLVKGLARRAISRRAGVAPLEPLSGQRALLPAALDALPGLAPGFGAEVGMTLDLLSSGITPLEVPLPLAHRTAGKTFEGFAHRARQGLDVLRALRGERVPW
ncbi:glycosyltransferase [Rubrobacter marinus]|uniref:Glucosyl-3-phosphoglycerate synthase n=1 Tax=Rubrobacter marinus TaxID=2653852 RepID=A0A6G8PXE1_9ACTN|nr:glycosyltransferase [Rubrobacter marinus]QIN78891.1 glycosyltransferase [Rubrobacter marinus]